MAKKLNPTILNQMIQDQSKTKTITVCGDYEVSVQMVFEESKIEKILTDYLRLIEQAQTEDSVSDDFLRGSQILYYTLVIREFTDLNETIPNTSELEKLYPYAKMLYDIGKEEVGDLGLMGEIIQAFDQKQIKRLENKLNKASEELVKIQTGMLAQANKGLNNKNKRSGSTAKQKTTTRKKTEKSKEDKDTVKDVIH